MWLLPLPAIGVSCIQGSHWLSNTSSFSLVCFNHVAHDASPRWTLAMQGLVLNTYPLKQHAAEVLTPAWLSAYALFFFSTQPFKVIYFECGLLVLPQGWVLPSPAIILNFLSLCLWWYWGSEVGSCFLQLVVLFFDYGCHISLQFLQCPGTWRHFLFQWLNYRSNCLLLSI